MRIVEPPTGHGIASGLSTIQHEAGITRGGQDFAAKVDPVASRATWPEPFKLGWLIGWELARAKAKQKPGA